MRELPVLNRVAEGLNRAPDVERALQSTLDLVAELLGLPTGWVWLLDPDTGGFYNAAVRDLPPYLLEAVRMTGESCWCIEAFLAGRLSPENIRLLQCSRLRPGVEERDTADTGGYSAHASIPLCAGGKPLGILNLATPAWRELTTEELQLLETIAYQVGIAVERARLAEEEKRLAREEERTRLAREIHDTLAQGLTAIGLQIEGALGQVEQDPEKLRERLERALALVRENLEEARRSVQGLRAAPLDGRGLPDALRALARAFTAETGVRVHARIGADLPSILPPQVETELFRIAQEALTNVRRHASATDATLTLDRTSGGLRLAVADNGVGFRPGGAVSGQGLAGMRERARLLGGQLRISGRPARGSRVTVQVPLPTEPPPGSEAEAGP